MLVTAILFLSSDTVVPPPSASTVLRANARTALPDSAFPPGTVILDDKGNAVGKVLSVEHGLVTVKTSHVVLRVPTSAFIMGAEPILVGVSSAQLDVLARTGLPAK